MTGAEDELEGGGGGGVGLEAVDCILVGGGGGILGTFSGGIEVVEVGVAVVGTGGVIGAAVLVGVDGTGCPDLKLGSELSIPSFLSAYPRKDWDRLAG